LLGRSGGGEGQGGQGGQEFVHGEFSIEVISEQHRSRATTKKFRSG
jgi:hypothetical protein